MKFISLFTRLGLLALGFILVAVVNDDSVWANASTSEPKPMPRPMQIIFCALRPFCTLTIASAKVVESSSGLDTSYQPTS